MVKQIKAKGIEIIVYEPEMQEKGFSGSQVMLDFSKFKKDCDAILASRRRRDLEDVMDKVFTRDLFGSD